MVVRNEILVACARATYCTSHIMLTLRIASDVRRPRACNENFVTTITLGCLWAIVRTTRISDKYDRVHFLHQSWTVIPLSVCLKILHTMNKNSPLTLILDYPYIYDNQTWNIDLETSSSLLESRTAIFVCLKSSISNAFLYGNFIRKLVYKIVRQHLFNVRQFSTERTTSYGIPDLFFKPCCDWSAVSG
jgi:hypothetical protein